MYVAILYCSYRTVERQRGGGGGGGGERGGEREYVSLTLWEARAAAVAAAVQLATSLTVSAKPRWGGRKEAGDVAGIDEWKAADDEEEAGAAAAVVTVGLEVSA